MRRREQLNIVCKTDCLPKFFQFSTDSMKNFIFLAILSVLNAQSLNEQEAIALTQFYDAIGIF